MKTIVIAAAALIGAAAYQSQAEENPIVNTVETVKEVAVNNQVTNFVVSGYNDIKQSGQDGIQESKDQLNRNKEQIVAIFANVKDAFNHYFVK